MTKELTEVKSSNVAAIGFDAGVLTVKYKNNRTYEYHGVPEELYNEILTAESVGQVLAEKVKGQYPTEATKKEEADETEDKTDGDSEPSSDTGDAQSADEAGTETGEDAGTEGVSDEDTADTASNEGEKPEAESGSVEQAEEATGDGSSEPAEEPGADTTDTPDSPPADDGNDADGTTGEDDTGETPVSGENSDDEGTDGGDEASEPETEAENTPNLGVDADEDTLEEMMEHILKHFGATGIEQDGVREHDQVIIFSVYKEDEDVSDVPIEIATGTLLELYNKATTKKPETELDQTPNEAQSENLNLLRDQLAKYEIDMQYERVEDKIGDRYWNLKTSIEREDRTLNFTTKIVENCTKDEAEAAAEEIIANFVKAE